MDSWLIEMAMIGDRDAFAKLVEKYHRFVLSIAYQFLKNQQDAEDIAQEVFLKVYNLLPQYNNEGKFPQFLRRIVINESISRLRKKKVRQTTPLEKNVVSQEKFPVEICENKELGEILVEATEQLPERQRTAFLLKTHGNCSYEEISSILGCPETSIGGLIFRARKSLMEKLKTIKDLL
ncbi:RNA polymerase sigma factor [Candidatus Uabimicrobium sp. HlEnr_7]|uniref:RNA polymerase sigma factor n=1 Tax=Candidatus Uabimicrobium helgolandensis TaxID=3095367 RepID=UPI003556F57B